MKMKTSHFILACAGLSVLALKIAIDAEIEIQKINAKRGMK